MIYLLVLLGSFLVLSMALGTQIIWRNRAVRSFVRSMQHRSVQAQERGVSLQESEVERPEIRPRFTSQEMQELRSILRDVDNAIRKDELQVAERLYIQALTIRPDAYDIQAELAKLYLKTNREPKAEALYREILQYSDDPACFANLGLAYYQQRKFDLAYEAYGEAFKKDPQNPERSFNYGRACIAAGKPEEATEHLEKAAIRLWRNTELLTILADCYENLGRHDDLLITYRKINRLEPYNRDVRARIEVLSA